MIFGAATVENRIVKEFRVKYKRQPAIHEELNSVPGTGLGGENK